MRQIINNLLSKEECNNLLSLVNNEAWEDALINTSKGSILQKSYRDNYRIIKFDPGISSFLYEKLKQREDIELINEGGWQHYGLNEMCKFYKYIPNQKFALHMDHPFIRKSNIDQSFQTLLVYLNDNYSGGGTSFIGMETVNPHTGMAVLFYHHLYHEGKEVLNGEKYLLRTDLMYRKI